MRKVLILGILCTIPFAVAGPTHAQHDTDSEGATSARSIDVNSAIIQGLDHIPIAVDDLQAAAARYRALGFSLKPGRSHPNGIRNAHAKFPDGTELELITADEARDALTGEYLRHLSRGEGPAFLALYVPEIDRLALKLDQMGKSYHRARRTLSFPEADSLTYIFFGRRNASPTDLPEHFDHRNRADALVSVWLAGDDFSAERGLFAAAGATFEDAEVHVPKAATATVARLAEGTVVLLPASHQTVAGRRIIGATLRTRSLDALTEVLKSASMDVPLVVATRSGRSIFLPPDVTHGIWLEFVEPY